MRDESYTPFEGKRDTRAPSMRVLRRFTKDSHVAEIRERKVTLFGALEFFVFIDDALQESQMFHGARLDAYPAELDARVRQFVDSGWARVGEPQSPA